jgi:multidrug resistance protein, MATE family
MAHLESNSLIKKTHAPGGVHELLAIALPMVVSHACDTVMVFTDRLFLSRVGSEQMTAAMAGGLTCFTVMTFFLGLTGYTTALVAQNLGAGRQDKCAVVTTQAILIALAAYPLILLARPLIHWIFAHTGIPESQLIPQIQYFDIIVYATLIGLVRNCLSSFFSGIGRTRIVMVAACVAMIVNVGMNYVLIFGKLGFPTLGIRGAAMGTIMGGVCGLSVLLSAYLGPRIRRQFDVWRSFYFDRESMGTLCRFGYPAGVEMFLNLLAFNAIVLTFHGHGPATATAVTVMFNWSMVSFVPLIGVQIGVMSLMGRYMGARQPDIGHRATISGLKSAWSYSAVILVIYVCFPRQLIGIFDPGPEDAVFAQAMPMALTMLRVMALYVTVEAVMVVFSGALRGAGDTFWAMALSVFIHWALLAVQLIFMYGLGQSPQVTWTALVFTLMACSSLFYWRYRSGKWRNIQVVPSQAEALATDHDHDFHEPREL